MWSVQVPCGAQYRNAVQLLLEQLDAIKRLLAAQSQKTRLVTSTLGNYSLQYDSLIHIPLCHYNYTNEDLCFCMYLMSD